MKDHFCLLIVATLLICAGLDGQMAVAPAVRVATDIETTQTTHLVDGNVLKRTTTARFFRDGAGRTRYEQGDLVSISDPISRTALMLDVSKRTATRISFPAASQGGTAIGRTRLGASNSGGNSMQLAAELGTRVIDGIEATGKRYILTIPTGSSFGNTNPLERITEVWHSAAVQMTLLVIVKDPIAGNLVTAYKHIQTNPELDPNLFRIPSGFTITEQTPTAK